MAEVGGVGGSQQTQQTNNEASRDLGKLESKQDAQALDAQLDAQHARQSEDAARQLGLGTSFSAIVAQLNQLQMSPQTGGQQDYREIAGPGNGQSRRPWSTPSWPVSVVAGARCRAATS